MLEYLSFYGLKYNPFSIEHVNKGSCFNSKDFNGVYWAVNRVVNEGGICAIYGNSGSGCSYCTAHAVNKIGKSSSTICSISAYHISVRDFFKKLCIVTEAKIVGKGRDALISSSVTKMKEIKRQNHPLILVIDNAQYLPLEVFLDLKSFVSGSYECESLCKLVLTGNIELYSLLIKADGMDKLVTAYHEVKGFRRDEIKPHIQNRLMEAGNKDISITDDAADTLYSISGEGNCREVNRIMSDALYIGCQYKISEIDGKIIKSAQSFQFARRR